MIQVKNNLLSMIEGKKTIIIRGYKVKTLEKRKVRVSIIKGFFMWPIAMTL